MTASPIQSHKRDVTAIHLTRWLAPVTRYGHRRLNDAVHARRTVQRVGRGSSFEIRHAMPETLKTRHAR